METNFTIDSKNIKVSILVPVYNTEKYLNECLESLHHQSLKEIEIICINDGSTDSSLKVIEQYVQKDSRFICISKENTGYGDSMNVGLHYAKGKYIGILESDDYARLDMFERLYQIADKYNLDILKSNFYSVNGEDIQFEECLYNVQYDVVGNIFDIPELLEVNPTIWTGLYKKEFLDMNLLSFNISRRASFQDLSFGILSLCYANKIMCIKDAFIYYRNDNNESSVKSKDRPLAVYEEFKIIEEHMKYEKEIMHILNLVKFRHLCGNYERVSLKFKSLALYLLKDNIDMLNCNISDLGMLDELSEMMNI